MPVEIENGFKMNDMLKISVVIPVFNDWECLVLLLKQIDQEMKDYAAISVFVVNDGSTIAPDEDDFIGMQNLYFIHLTRNLGHQKAIAVGLCHVAENVDCDAVMVMDADGEDRPADLLQLVQVFQKEKKIVFAKRQKRNESIMFKIFYQLYKVSFYLLTGVRISFGNYCILPINTLKQLVHVSEIWNHFSGGVIRSKLPYTSIPLDRGSRLVGSSKMNLVSLIIHGVSSFTVHLDTVAVRLLLLLGGMILASIIGAVYVTAVKYFTAQAIPGWATYTVLGLIIIILQAFFALLNLTFSILFARTQRLLIPALHYKDYVEAVITSHNNDQ
ncbi:MAG: glycosyltransferase family 2 protein [Nitrospira sp.]|nr:glycosyltransferase family 2 protein [bacterium]MBL7050188.1 glycosyltransferase family 2 protein [Nitrospira sp.]